MDVVKDIVFKRVEGAKYSTIKHDIRMFNIFFAVDGRRSVQRIAREDHYDLDYLLQAIHKMEKMGLLIPVDGATSEDISNQTDEIFVRLPAEYRTGINAVDQQHQRLVDMVNQLDVVRKAPYPTMDQKQRAVGNVVAEMVDYTISHFAFEESLMEDAHYKFYNAHKRIHGLLIQRAGEYKARWASGEDIADELYDVLSRWLYNHIRNDDRAFAPSVLKRIRELDLSDRGWLSVLLKRFFNNAHP